MYYSFKCPKCGAVLSEWEADDQASWDANYKLDDLLKQHYSQMHAEEQQPLTDSELDYAVKSGMQTSEDKLY